MWAKHWIFPLGKDGGFHRRAPRGFLIFGVRHSGETLICLSTQEVQSQCERLGLIWVLMGLRGYLQVTRLVKRPGVHPRLRVCLNVGVPLAGTEQPASARCLVSQTVSAPCMAPSALRRLPRLCPVPPRSGATAAHLLRRLLGSVEPRSSSASAWPPSPSEWVPRRGCVLRVRLAWE